MISFYIKYVNIKRNLICLYFINLIHTHFNKYKYSLLSCYKTIGYKSEKQIPIAYN